MRSELLRSSSLALALLACGGSERPLVPGPQPHVEPPEAVVPSNGDAPGTGGSTSSPMSPSAAGAGVAESAGAASAVAGSGADSGLVNGRGVTAPSGPSGISVDSATGELVFRTEPVELGPQQEAYVCYAATLEQDVVVDGFDKALQPFVHHEQFVISILPEPEGASVCNEQFKLTWLPIFLAGAGASELRLDEGVGHVLTAGTQLTLQMHLLNAREQTVKEAVEVRMHRAASPDVTPVAPWAIGSADIQIPPGQAGRAQKVCTQTGPVEVLAVFPHMHTLGTRMTIEVGKSLDAMRPLYARDPFDFDDQRMEKVHLTLDTGDLLRVTCDFQNTTDSEVTFGESTHDEMCFFVGFALGDAPNGADCPDLWEHLFTL